MCMNRHGMAASVLMTSTWHRVNGPMSGLMERARAGDFPLLPLLRLRGPGALPGESQRQGPGAMPLLPAGPVVPFRSRLAPRGAAQGEALRRALRDRFADPEGPRRPACGPSRPTTSAWAPGPTASGSPRSTRRATSPHWRSTTPACRSIWRWIRGSSPARCSSRWRRGADGRGGGPGLRRLPRGGRPRGAERPGDPRGGADALRRPDRHDDDRPGGRVAEPGRPDGHRRVSSARASARCGAGRAARWPTAWRCWSRSSSRPTAASGC